MPKRFLPPAFIVVVDTNAIYSKDATALINSEFSPCWKECCKITELLLVVPEVVREERIFQLFTSAKQNVKDASKTLDKICRVSGCEKLVLPPLDVVKKGIHQQFDAWAKKHSATIRSVPHETIDWKRVILDAIWRNQPFSPPAENKDSEKGFRDCLILETLGNVIQSANGKHVCFLTADKLMQEATQTRFDSNKVSLYDNIKAFFSYLQLLKQKESEETVNAILEKAPTVFYTEDDPECVYFKHEIFQGIKTEFSATLDVHFDIPQSTATVTPSGVSTASLFGAGSLFGFSGLVMYSPASEEKPYIDATELAESTGSIVTWKTNLRFVRLFKKQLNPSISLPFPSLEEVIRTQEFAVIWQAKIDSKLDFHELKVIRFELGSASQESAYLNKAKYGFPEDPPFRLQNLL